jgi:hypothetical protein
MVLEKTVMVSEHTPISLSAGSESNATIDRSTIVLESEGDGDGE